MLFKQARHIFSGKYARIAQCFARARQGTQQVVQRLARNNSRAYTSTSAVAEQEPLSNTKGRKAMRVWLLTVGGMVFSIVIVGGLTRLTESGLSIVYWKPLGNLPPMNQAEWEAEFEQYKQFPEYKKFA